MQQQAFLKTIAAMTSDRNSSVTTMKGASMNLFPGSPAVRTWRRIILVCALILLPTLIFAQYQTGNIYGKVVTKDNTPLPGVTVTMTGIGAPQTFITDSDGNFRFLSLSPGNYTVKADLEGMGSAVRGPIEVNVGRNANVILPLTPKTSETITIVATAPLVDTRETKIGATITSEELRSIPTARDPWVMLQQAPGVLIDRINVGGNESGQQSNYTANGVTGDQATWNIDGVNITDMGALGSSPTYYDFDAFEEMQITTSGSDPRIATPGVQLNLVAKRGTNDLKGSGRFFLTSHSWQSNPSVPTEARSYLDSVNKIDNIQDRGLELGGPLWKDHLWAWASYGQNDIKNFPAFPTGVVFPVNAITLKDTNAKLNAQVVASNQATLFLTRGDKIYIGRNSGPTRLPETSFDQSGPTTLYKLEDTQVFGPRLFLTALASKVTSGFQFAPEGGMDVISYRDTASVNHSTYYRYQTERPQKNDRLDGSAFMKTGTLDHELKFGFGYRNAPVTSITTWPGDQRVILRTDAQCTGAGLQPGCAQVRIVRPGGAKFGLKNNDLYLGDTIIVNNLTINAGLRYDHQNSRNLPSSVPAASSAPDIVPGGSFAGGDNLTWNTVSPRIGLTYAFNSAKRTIVRGAYNRYSNQVAANQLFSANPYGGPGGMVYLFQDLNGDHVMQRPELRQAQFPYGYFDPSHPSAVISPIRIGNAKSPQTDELMFGVERELNTDFSAGANVTYRKLTKFIYYHYEKTAGQGDWYTPAELAGHTPGGEPIYTTKDGSTPTFAAIDNRPDYSQKYSGLELFLTRRMTNNWMMRGNVSFNDWTQHVGQNGFVAGDPTHVLQQATVPGQFQGSCSSCSGVVTQSSGVGSGSKQDVYINSKWAASITGSYQFPMQISFGGSLTARQGYPRVVYYDSEDFEASKFVLEQSIDKQRYANILNLDLRLAKEIKIAGAAGLSLSIDMFNVLNRRPILQRISDTSSAGLGQIEELQSPRVFRLGARFSF
jgi:hypothetical protein